MSLGNVALDDPHQRTATKQKLGGSTIGDTLRYNPL